MEANAYSFTGDMSDLYLAYISSQGDLHTVYCAQGIELIITRKAFYNLCCPKISLK